MNKTFWDEMAKRWCKSYDYTELARVAEKASEQAKEEQMYKAGYSRNSLDDEEDEDYL